MVQFKGRVCVLMKMSHLVPCFVSPPKLRGFEGEKKRFNIYRFYLLLVIFVNSKASLTYIILSSSLTSKSFYCSLSFTFCVDIIDVIVN